MAAQEQGAVDGVFQKGLIFRITSERADRGQQQGAERGAPDRARAAEDRDAADDHRGHRRQLDAVPATASSVP